MDIPTRNGWNLTLKKHSEQSDGVDEAVNVLRAYLLSNQADGLCFRTNRYPKLIVIDPQNFRTLKEYLRVCKHEFYHARNGTSSEKKAKRAEYRN